MLVLIFDEDAMFVNSLILFTEERFGTDVGKDKLS